MGGGEEEKPAITYVTPCNVIGSGVVLRVNGTTLGTNEVIEPLSHILVDDITSDRAASFKGSYSLACYWGSNTGERKDYYYCNGSYVAPDINDNGVITRKLRKNFRIGFGVQEFKGENWIDLQGVRHEEQNTYDLTVGSIDSRCIVV